MQLFFTGFLQVLFVAINTYMIAHRYYICVFIFGFLISLIWTWNVKRVVFGTITDRLCFAFGAGVGALSGVIVSVGIVKLI